MYSIEELKEKVKCQYPSKNNGTTSITINRRIKNMKAFFTLIKPSIVSDPSLKNEIKEIRIKLFETQKGEKIYLQYPGKESNRKKGNPYDFRPKILTSDNEEVKDLSFEDIYLIIKNVIEKKPELKEPLACILYRMSRMVDHQEEIKSYKSEILQIQEKSIVPHSDISLNWYKYTPEQGVLATLNQISEGLITVDKYSISLEAFLYYIELLTCNEDLKYNRKNKKINENADTENTDTGTLIHAKINSIQSIFLYIETLNGTVSLASSFQRLIKGRGVATISSEEIESVTGNLVKLIDIDTVEKNLKRILVEKGLGDYDENKAQNFVTTMRWVHRRIVVIPKNNRNQKTKLEKAGWTVFLLENMVNKDYLEQFVEALQINHETSETI